DFAQPVKKKSLTPREERIIAGFEDIQQFVEDHGRVPEPFEDRDIFERLYATRLQRMRVLQECRDLLMPFDYQNLLQVAETSSINLAELDDDALLEELSGITEGSELTKLRHVRSNVERRAAEEIADRTPCKDFHLFRPLFLEVQKEIEQGIRKTMPFARDGSIEQGNFFILSGQKAYVADVGKGFRGTDGRQEFRLRVIFDNGVESNQLMRSLQKRLWEDKASRRISEPSYESPGPLFADTLEDDDIESGTIYVLRSQSNNPFIAEHRELIHKIGVTGGKVETRIANAAQDPTYLLANVEVVATYKLAGINCTKMESLIHRIFALAKLDLEIEDRFGRPVKPQEWFLVPLSAIDEAVEHIRSGTITSVVYEPQEARLILAK
ncbi:MAG TPA: GIY-YIG nuclease family protein, partial [Paenalcaligenes sp.]|nr:GIY-YIG nuclease family protein [Paenalcaligenes sp.]